MWSVREALEKFIQSLKLTDRQKEEVIRQHTVVREQLRRRLGVETDFLSGSYSRNTAIRPLHDIDLVIVVEEVTSRPTVSPDALLKAVRKALKAAWPEKELPILQQHSVHLKFSGSGIAFDIVPAFKRLGRKAYFIPERETGRWLRTNPRRHKEQSREANERAGKKLKPLLRAVKHWNRHHPSSPLGSFHLEAMSYDAFLQPPDGYLEGLEILFSHLSQKVLYPCPDPAGLGPDVDEWMTSQQRQAASQLLASAADQVQHVLAEEESFPSQAHQRLRALFGEDYRDRGR